MQKKIVRKLFHEAGIVLNGQNPWDIKIKDERFYGRLLQDKNLALGEAYVNGWWDCQQVDEAIHRILKRNLEGNLKGGWRPRLDRLAGHLFNLQSRSRAGIIASRHYDIGNDLFMSFLDPYNQYSCAYFNGTDDLAQAQIKKLDLICKKLNITKTDSILDVGCGWGGFAKYAAEHYGCSVTGINVSEEQNRYAAELCKGLPVRIETQDYRDQKGVFDKVVSIGMFEHVGVKNYRNFMKVADRCLKKDGIFLLHTIGSNTSLYSCDPWITAYIFPNSMLPSIAQIGKAIEGLFVVEDLHNLGPHYDKTLMAWNRNFQNTWPNLKDRYGEHFKRMWEYFLLSSAGAFRARSIQLWQLVLTKQGTPQPACRF